MVWIIVAYLLINVWTFVAYARDKAAARKNQWRVRESHLHLLALCGGWPAAWLAQRVLRHKTRQLRFLLIYGCTVLIHLGGVCAWRAWQPVVLPGL